MESKTLQEILQRNATLKVHGAGGTYLTAKREADDYNASAGDLPDFDCTTCKNKGYVAKLVDGAVIYERCKCHAVRLAATLIRRSGIKSHELLSDIRPMPWQAEMYTQAVHYAKTRQGWLYFGGQVGSGKTMIATAIVNEMLKELLPCRYMLWRDMAVELKACVNLAEDYRAIIQPLKTVKVLYIDDLFKTERDKQPTQADVNLSFEIINARYNNPELLTIITSERALEELLDIDEAVGSRIYQRAKEHYCYVEPDTKKNYRLKPPSAHQPKIDEDLI